MTRTEFAEIVRSMKALYTDPKFIADNAATEVWYGLLQDLDGKAARTAAVVYMQTHHFPPTPADIREEAYKLTRGDELTGAEAWVLVVRALRRSIYYSEEEFEKLPESAQKAVGNPATLREWAQMSSNDVETIEKSHFLRAYDTAISRKESLAKLPEAIRMLLGGGGAPLLEEGEA